MSKTGLQDALAAFDLDRVREVRAGRAEAEGIQAGRTVRNREIIGERAGRLSPNLTFLPRSDPDIRLMHDPERLFNPPLCVLLLILSEATLLSLRAASSSSSAILINDDFKSASHWTLAS